MRYIVGCALGLCAIALSDTITLTDGQVITQTIVSETADEVIVTPDPDATVVIRRSIPRSSIKQITREAAPAGVTYFDIPLVGTVGEEITADAIRDALAAARQQNATYTVFLIDSPGGLVSELVEIVEVMSENRDLNTIAFVKRAHSAAAIIAATCDSIVMYPGSQMGAAAPYAIEKGQPKAVEDKVLAQVRALSRTAAACGGQPQVVFEAMVDPTTEIYITPGDPPRLSAMAVDATSVLAKGTGRILMLNDQDAVQWNVAAGVCRNYGEVRQALNIPQWTARSARGRAIMARHAEQHRARIVQLEIEHGEQEAVEQYREAAIPELQQLRERIISAQAELTAASEALTQAKQQRDISLHRIAQGVMPDYEQQKDTRSAGFYLNRSEESDRAAMEVVEQAYQKRAGELTQTMRKLEAQLKSDTARAKELIDKAPRR